MLPLSLKSIQIFIPSGLAVPAPGLGAPTVMLIGQQPHCSAVKVKFELKQGPSAHALPGKPDHLGVVGDGELQIVTLVISSSRHAFVVEGQGTQAFPVMKELHEKFGSRGFLVLAISVDEQQAALQNFLKKDPPPFIVLRDAKGRLAEAAGVEKMPTSFLIGANGKVTGLHSGFDGESTRKKYLSEIESALTTAGK